jgi:hypothetical protein
LPILLLVTQEYEIDKAVIDNKEYFIMDTPGFDPENEQKTFLEIVRGIKTIRHFARIAGLLYLTCINQPRFDDFDRKLIRFIRALCCDEYLPRITFVTTFWTAAGARQQATFNQQLESLRRNWQEGFDNRQLSLYQHGREYNSDGLDTGSFLNWFENRDQVAQHAKNMIARRYGGPATPENCIVAPKVVLEVDANTPVHSMDAGKLLGLLPASFPTASSCGPSGDPGEESAQRNTTPTGNSDPGEESAQRNTTPTGDSEPRPGHDGRPAAGQATTPSDSQEESDPHQTSPSFWTQMVGWLTRNVSVNIDLSHTGQNPTFPRGNAYNGPLGKFALARNVNVNIDLGRTGQGSTFPRGNVYNGPLGKFANALEMEFEGLTSR